MIAIAFLVGIAIGIVAGYLARRYRISLLAENNHWVGEEIEAIKGADLDADVAAHRRERLSGEQPKVDLYDQDSPSAQVNQVERHFADPFDFVGIRGNVPVLPPAMTGKRDVEAQDRELVDIYGIDQGAGRQCNCAEPAVFAWKIDGFPFAACGRCVELWFPDGVPEWVERLDVVTRSLTATISGPRDQVEAAAEVIDDLIGLNAWGTAIHQDDDDPRVSD
jgi:hypothetical protein